MTTVWLSVFKNFKVEVPGMGLVRGRPKLVLMNINILEEKGGQNFNYFDNFRLKVC